MLNERQFRVLEMRNAGNTFKEIGLALDVSDGRARQIFHAAQRAEGRSKSSDVWSFGLGKKTANALISAGYKDKNSVIAGLESGKIGVHPITGKGFTFGIGHQGIAEIRKWLGVDSSEELAIKAAIVLLEKHGYKVCKA